MRKLLPILAVTLLTGCAITDAYLMAKFDSNEYQQMTQIRVDARRFKNDCDSTETSKLNALDLANETELFVAYSEHLPHNSDSTEAATTLNEIAQGLAVRYKNNEKVTQLFCKLKFEGIEHSADLIQKTLGNRPR
jgi:hypothetical protein